MRTRSQTNQFRDFPELARVIIEKAPIGIYTINKKGVIDSFNPKMVEIAGAKKASQAIGLNALKLSTYKKVGLDKLFRQGLKGKSFETELRYTSYTGHKQTWRRYRGVPLLGKDKKIEHLLLLVEDITERKRLEAKLNAYTGQLEKKVAKRTADLKKVNDGLKREIAQRQKAEEKYRALFEQAADSIILIDPQSGKLVEFNDRAHKDLGYSREEFKHLTIADFEANESAGRVKKHIQKILEQKSDTFETRHRTKQGKIRHVLVSARAISIGGESFIQSMWRDISAIKQAEEKQKAYAQQLEKLNEVMVGRELKMKQLKQEILQLRTKLDQAGLLAESKV